MGSIYTFLDGPRAGETVTFGNTDFKEVRTMYMGNDGNVDEILYIPNHDNQTLTYKPWKS